jgi:hypothetical protein
MSSPAATFPWRLAALGGLSFPLYLVATLWQPPLSQVHQPSYVLWFSAVYLVYVVGLLDIRRHTRQPHPALLPLIVGWAVVFRLSLLWVRPGFLSDDIYRYLWDGLVQQSGINPYYYPPEAPELAFLRDDAVYPMLNRPWALTIYPPGAQLFFRLVAWIRPGDLVAMKTLILLADLASVALLLRLLRRLGLPQTGVLLYAWNPLVIVELGLSGHLDGVMLPFVLLALLWSMRGRPGRAGAALGMAALIKLYPALLLPALYRKRCWSMPLVCLGLVLLGYLLYLEAGARVFGYLPSYLAPDEYYNLSLRPILIWLIGLIAVDPVAYATWLSGIVLLGAMLWCARRPDKTPHQALQWGIGLIACYLFAVSPSVFQWYLVWFLALVTLTPSGLTPAWLYWGWSVNVDYLAWLGMFTDARQWLRVAEYVPVFLWIIGYWWWTYRKKHSPAPCGDMDAAGQWPSDNGP